MSGRISDHFLAPDGSVVHGQFFTHILLPHKWIYSFTVTQTSTEEIEIHYIPSGNVVEADQQEILRKIRVFMGESCELKWIVVDQLPVTSGGKMIFTRSLINRSKDLEPAG